MKTGERFWQLIGLTFLILVGYLLAEFNDAVDAKGKSLQDQRVLLSKQEALINDNQWDLNLSAVSKLREQWLGYLPVEASSAVAKAHLLSELRTAAINAGIANAVVNTTDSANVGQSGSGGVDQSTKSSAKTALTPPDVHMVKADISGRFDPTAFNKLMRALEERHFTVIERADIRGTQMNLTLRCYWHSDVGNEKASARQGSASPVKAQS